MTGDTQTPAAGTTAAADPQICDGGLVRIGQLTDRTVINISLADAATTTVLRQRMYGAWLTVGTIAGPTGQLVDRTINPRTVYTYRLIAKSAAGAVVTDCQTYGYLGIWGGGRLGRSRMRSMRPGPGGLRQTSPYNEGHETAAGAWVAPSYSADGRLVAGTLVDEATGAGVLKVLSARTGAESFTVDHGAGRLPGRGGLLTGRPVDGVRPLRRRDGRAARARRRGRARRRTRFSPWPRTARWPSRPGSRTAGPSSRPT